VQAGRPLRVVQAWHGRHRVVELDVDGDAAPRVLLAGDRQFGAFAASASRLLVAPDAPTQPSELQAAGLDGNGERCCSAFNTWWSGRTPIRCQSREFEVPDGAGGTETIEGWLLRGPQDGPAPLLDDVHGGPAAYALLDYDTNVYWQVLCSQGWSVLALNPVGSASYGRRFCDRLRGRWGGLDLPQHLAAIDRLRADGLCDDRLALAGKSYGGFLTAWALGHADAFRAAVVMSPVGNLETHYGTSDGGWYVDPFFLDCGQQFDREHARRLSPVQAITQARAPTLFLQGKADERTPQCQSEELFASLARAQPRLPSELVLYPGCDHHFLNAGPPSVRIDAAHRITRWLGSHAAASGNG
jgi:dipeptidyl aminopeptidase/acylaminoacyl peptidase